MRPCKEKLGFIAHPTNYEYFKNYINYLKPGKAFNNQLILKLFEWCPSYKVGEFPDLSFDGLANIDCAVIVVPFIPEMRDFKLKQIKEKIEQALEVAAEHHCTVVSLGTFTSILMQGREQELEERFKLRITSGNTFTAALIIKAIEDLCRRLSIPLHEITMGIIGASGDIGSGCLLHFGQKVKKMILTARGLDGLETITRKHRDEIRADYILTIDNRQALECAQIIIIATSAYQSLFKISDFRKGTIICDASAPLNVDVTGAPHPDVLLFHGGICKVPFKIDLGFDIGLPDPFHIFGCMGEGLLNAFYKDLPNSWGRGEITKDKLNRYFTYLDEIPGLKYAYTVGKHVYTGAEIEAYGNFNHVTGSFLTAREQAEEPAD